MVFTQGEEGVKTVLKIMKNELERAMMLAGIKMLVNFNDTVSDATWFSSELFSPIMNNPYLYVVKLATESLFKLNLVQ